jgi:hypothetical protein
VKPTHPKKENAPLFDRSAPAKSTVETAEEQPKEE